MNGESKNNLRNNIFTIIIIAISGAIIYGLPYFRLDYYDAYKEIYKLSNTEIGTFGSIFGVFGMISYLFGGYVADRVSIRKLISISLIGTALGGFLHLLPLNYMMLLVLYGFWGITSLFAFWPSCVKAVRLLSSKDEQGRAFGIFEGARGIATAIVTALVVIVFKSGADKAGDVLGIKYLIVFYSVACLIAGVLVFILMKDETISDGDRMKIKDVGKVLKIPAVWIIAIVTLCNYVFTMSHYYFTPYMTTFLGASVVLGAGVAAARRYVAPISNVGGGFIGDKIGTSNLLIVSFILMAICTVVQINLPINKSMLMVFIVIYMVNFFFYNVNYSLIWAMMEEGSIPLRFSGTAAGIIATIGYLPEVFCPIIAGRLIDNAGESVSGFHQYFYFVVVMLILGAVFVGVWRNYLKKHKIQKEFED